MTFGGGINNIKQISEILRNGADKVSINTSALNNKNFLKAASKKFGSQCIVVSIDVKKKTIIGLFILIMDQKKVVLSLKII